MRLERARWWWSLPIMVVAVIVDTELVHFWVFSLLAAGLTSSAAWGQWRRGNRAIGVAVFVFGCACLIYAGEVTMRLARRETLVARSVAFAVASYVRVQGKPPENVEALVPAYLPERPTIRSPLVGRVKYRREADGHWCVVWGNVRDFGGVVCDQDGAKTAPARH
jgi:hypothetical protein